jgi:hypothetical protein
VAPQIKIFAFDSIGFTVHLQGLGAHEQRQMQSYPEIVGFDVNAETFRESSVEWEAWSRNQDVLPRVREHSNGEVQGTGAPTAQHHILRTTVHNKRFRPQFTKHRINRKE